MTAHIIRGNALDLPLPDASVDLVMTSPPYFGLRSYTDNGAHYAGQIGSEATPAEFVAALLAATAEMVRVLKPSGSIFVNLGDKYADDTKWGGGIDPKLAYHQNGDASHGARRSTGMPRKSLMGIPWRYALACIDQLGLILRAEIIWAKPNGLPESVTDRVRRSHETWLHFTKSPRYFSAVDEIREEYEPAPKGKHDPGQVNGTKVALTQRAQSPLVGIRQPPNPLGKLPGSVWTIPTQPLTVPPELGVDHFAAFPMEWPRRIIAGWSPTGICTVCGEGRRPVAHASALGRVEDNSTWTEVNGHDRKEHLPGAFQRGVTRTITGYTCGCPVSSRTGDLPQVASEPPNQSAVVLDPFGGTGTTALVASVMGRIGISVDMSADYCRLAEWRVQDPGQRAAAAQVEKVDAVSPDQLDLFNDMDLYGQNGS